MSDASAAPTTPPAPTATQPLFEAPFIASHFKMVIGKLVVGQFIECSGPNVIIDTVEWRESGQSQVVHHIPTLARYETLYLRQGLTRKTELWDWFAATLRGEITRLPVSIILLDSRGTTPVVQWDLAGTFPVSFTGARLLATGRDVYIHEYGLKYEGIERVSSNNA